MDAIHPINPNTLFFLQGPAQPTPASYAGSGFVTNQALLTNSGTAPDTFFRTLLVKPYANQVPLAVDDHILPACFGGSGVVIK